jgi:hypothetical protein
VSTREELEIELRGQMVTVEFTVQERDPSVGIMGYGFEEESLTDADGFALDWELTDAERELVANKVDKMCRDIETDDFYHYP